MWKPRPRSRSWLEEIPLSFPLRYPEFRSTFPGGAFPFFKGTAGTSRPWNKGKDCGATPDFAGPAFTESGGSPLMREGGGRPE